MIGLPRREHLLLNHCVFTIVFQIPGLSTSNVLERAARNASLMLPGKERVARRRQSAMGMLRPLSPCSLVCREVDTGPVS